MAGSANLPIIVPDISTGHQQPAIPPSLLLHPATASGIFFACPIKNTDIGLNPMGRPTIYSEELIDEICARIVAGDSLAAICREECQPSYKAVMVWLTKYESFKQKYARARVDSADSVADEIKDIATRVLNGKLDPQAARVAIDALKWDAGRKKPKVYGDRLELAGDQSAPLTVQVVRLGDAGK